VLNGPPFSTYTKVRQTWIEGKMVFTDEDHKDRTYRDGGLWLPKPKMAPALAKFAPLPSVESQPRKQVNAANPKQTWVFGDRIHTAAGKVITNGVVVIEDGKIRSVSSDAQQMTPPKEAAVYYASDVTPGLIDSHCVAGLSGAWNIPADQDQ